MFRKSNIGKIIKAGFTKWEAIDKSALDRYKIIYGKEPNIYDSIEVGKTYEINDFANHKSLNENEILVCIIPGMVTEPKEEENIESHDE